MKNDIIAKSLALSGFFYFRENIPKFEPEGHF
jgi:hypothetical protein